HPSSQKGVTGGARGGLSFPPVGIRVWWRQTHGDEIFLPKGQRDKDLGTFVSATPLTPLGQRDETPGLSQPSQTAHRTKALGPARLPEPDRVRPSQNRASPWRGPVPSRRQDRARHFSRGRGTC